MKHPTDLEPNNLKFSDEQKESFNKYVASTRIRAARNIRGQPLPPGATRESAAAVEATLKTTFEGLEGDLKGTYYPLTGMDDATRDDLLSQGFLFQKPKTTNLLTNAGAARFWPESRGIFHNENKTALAWCNEEDHCRIISMAMGGDVKDVFARFCSLSEAVKSAAEGSGAALMWNETHGFLGSCPSNIGTGLRGSVMIKLEKLNENVPLLEEICESFDLQPRGSAGEHSAAVGAKWDVSNKQVRSGKERSDELRWSVHMTPTTIADTSVRNFAAADFSAVSNAINETPFATRFARYSVLASPRCSSCRR